MHPTHQPVSAGTGLVSELTPADTLRRAALYLQRHGWIQGDYHGPGDELLAPACAAGAIAMAVYGAPLYSDQRPSHDPAYAAAVLVFEDYLARTTGAVTANTGDIHYDGGGVYRWNDEPGRTAEQAIAALKAAADDWDRLNGGAR